MRVGIFLLFIVFLNGCMPKIGNVTRCEAINSPCCYNVYSYPIYNECSCGVYDNYGYCNCEYPMYGGYYGPDFYYVDGF